MAKLTPGAAGSPSGLNIEESAPAGQYVAVCLEIIDLFGVTRHKFQSHEEELQDVTRFIFGVYDAAHKLYLVQTYEFKISTAPGANLMKFLKSWLGGEPPMGWDYMEQKGKPASITVEIKRSTKNPAIVYSAIAGIGPIFPQMASYVPPVHIFEPLLIEARKARQQQPASAPATRPAAPAPAAQPPSPAAPPWAGAPAPATPTAASAPQGVPSGPPAGGWQPPATTGAVPPNNTDIPF